MIHHQVDPTAVVEIGRRLAITRKALGYTTTTMCRLMGSSTGGSAYSNYEIGLRRIGLDQALALCASCRLTLPWIYQGQLDTLPSDIRRKIIPLLPPKDGGQQTTRKSRAS